MSNASSSVNIGPVCAGVDPIPLINKIKNMPKNVINLYNYNHVTLNLG